MNNFLLSKCLLLVIIVLLKIGCDGVFGSKKENDRCGVCGGDGLSCHAVSGIFTRRNLPYGYNLVSSIPKGACNINVTEMLQSKNYLALKLEDGGYILNGNWRLEHSRRLSAAATTFHYYRPSVSDHVSAREYITATGPTNQSIEIMILRQDVNQGIMYSYTIPTKRDNPEEKAAPPPVQPPPAQHRRDDGVPIASDQQSHTGTYEYPNLQTQRTLDTSLSQHNKNNRLYPDGQKSSDTHYSASNHRLRHERHRRKSRSHRHTNNRLVVQSAPERRYDFQALSGRSTAYSYGAYQPNQAASPSLGQSHGTPHIISALTPEGRRRYQYAHQRNQQNTHNQGGFPDILPAYKTYDTNDVHSRRGQNDYLRYTNPYSQTINTYNNRQQQNSYYPDAVTLGRDSLNDQISIALPDSKTNQIGNLDTVNDYSWRISGFTECTRTCGGGTQTTVIVCVKGGSQALVTDENCDNALRPDLQTIACNNSPCAPAWEVGNWTRCSTDCDPGTKTREVSCKQRVSSKLTLDISDNLCRNLARPETVATCNDDRPCVRWKIGNWTKCSAACGRGQRSREVQCVTIDDKPIAENKCRGTKARDTELCDMGSCTQTWFYSAWSKECSSDCGEGMHWRSLYCNAEEDRCKAINKPDAHKHCSKQLVPCGGTWFTGPWAKCSVECGLGVIRRDVVCIKKSGSVLVVVGEENCLNEDKPHHEEQCQRKPCRPKWYMTDWSECSKSCETGLRTRELKCLDENQEPNTLCALEEKPETRQTCNTMPCPTHLPAGGGCEDKFKNCQLVLQARLCSYSYYKSICCLSCSGYHDSHEH